MDWSGGNTILSAAGNWNSTKIKDRVNRGTAAAPSYFINEEDKLDNESGDPEYRMNLSLRHTMNNDVTVTVRGNFYGPYKNYNSSSAVVATVLATGVDYGRVTQWDTDVSWDLSEAYRLTLGINNVFDTMPDVGANGESCCGRTYRSDSVQDWQGTYYYVRGQISF